jgi:hypothetical protein
MSRAAASAVYDGRLGCREEMLIPRIKKQLSIWNGFDNIARCINVPFAGEERVCIHAVYLHRHVRRPCSGKR